MRLWQQVMCAVLMFLGGMASAADIPLGGVPVSIQLTDLPKITVEKPGGGWYDIVALNNSSGSDVTRYQVQLPVQITIRNERNFRVSLVDPLVLTHDSDASLTFTTEQVGFGMNMNSLQNLGPTPVDFSNPPMTGDTSIGSYLLSISARQPLGGLGKVSGNYGGKLVLMFEVKV